MTAVLQGFRLSPQQVRVWIAAQVDSGWPLFSLTFFEVEGDLESRTLERAVEAVVVQHEILRTEIQRDLDGTPLQVVVDRPSYRFSVIDARDASESEMLLESALRDLAAGNGSTEPTIWLMRRANAADLLVLGSSAITSDRQGLHNLARAILRAYGAFRDGRELSEEPVQYADVAEIFCRLLESEETRAGREYWRDRWPADTVALRPLVGRSSPARDGPYLLVIRRALSPELAAHLADIARRQKVSIEALVAACWLTVLCDACGVRDLWLGVIVDGRDFEGLPGALGPFARCLPLHVSVQAKASFRDLVQGIGRDLTEIRRFQDYFVAEPGSFLPFCYQFSSAGEIVEEGLRLRPLQEQATSDRFHLMLALVWDRGAPDLALFYDARNYGQDEVEELADAQLRALGRCIPSAPVEALFASIGSDRRDGEGDATPTGKAVVEIWVEILAIDGIGVQDNFFDLGGHSLLATRVLSRVRTVFGVELPLLALFEAPTAAEFAERIDLALRGDSAAAGPPIEPVERSGPLPLSFAQQRLWFLHQLEPDSPAYNIASTFLVAGELEVALLEQSLSAVVRRHEILRTVFAAVDGEPVQVIRPASVFQLALVDLRGLEAERGRATVRHLAVEESRRPFDLARGPLLRSTIVQLSLDEHAVLMTMHHIISDGWSMGLFNSELMSLYASLRAGGASSLPELRVQYADFAVWQRRWLSGEMLKWKLSFWRERLAGVPPVLDLPTDRPRPAVQSWRGSVRGFGLPESLSGALRELGQRREVTLFTLLLSAFEVLMSRWSGQSDLSVGTPIAGRTRLEIEGLIGMFVNTLVLRGDLRGDPGFGSFLKRTWSGVLEAYVHQDVPFEKLVEELVPERSLAHSPLFQVMFALQNVPEEQAGNATGLRMSTLPTGGGTATFDLMLALSERDGRLFGGLEYSTDLFDASTMARLLSHFENVLWSVVKEPEQPISALRLLSAGERAQVVVEWSHRSSGRVEGYRSVHELFAEEAGRSPEAIAVVSGIGSLSYGALDRSSNRWARRLRRLGVGRGSVVGVCLDRCQEMVAVLFGVLKAGAAYLPLDPSSPRQRLEYMLTDAGAGVLVTGRALGEALSGAVPLVVELEGEGERLAAESCARVASRVGPEDLAYVIYTSGSTGTPRGVLLKQGSLSSYARVVGGEFGLGPGERLLQFASLAFDTSAEEIFSCLLHGATLVLRPVDMLGSMPHFARRCEELSLTVLDLPTAFWHELTSWLETEGAALPASVRLVIIGGEQALRERVSSWHRLVGDRVRLWNGYGPTETTIVATFCELTGGGGVKRSGEGVSIGSAVPGGRAQLLDRDLRPVPIGVAGELCIGGVGVARGYAGRPELTAERFVPDPFGGVWAAAGSRLYRTGDLGRHRADGRLEFLGRIDHQVKVRGFRIELGEIESALLEHGSVREAVVVAREEDSGDRRLVGYVVMEPGSGVGEEELRVSLRGKLPEYMVPPVVMRLSSLPLTPTGKVDRKALPAPAPAGSTAPMLSRGPVEELVARIWCEVLGLDGIGGAESFFDLGGHSLLATRVLSRVRTVFAVELPLRALFEAPTVAGFAQRIDLALRSGDVAAESPIEPVDRSGPLPLSFAQHRLWFLHQLEPESPAYNISSAILVQGELDVASLEQSLSEVVRRHEILRTVFVALDGEPLQVIRPAAVFPLGLVDLRGLEAGRGQSVVKRLAVEEAERPFDLARGPLLRSTVVRLGPDEHAVLMTTHHIVSDGWSMGLFNSELMSLYGSLRAGRASSLPELRVQYADFAVWQRRWLSGEVLQRKLDFWRERLAGVPPVLDLPTDRPRPAVQSWRGSVRGFGLPESLSGALRELGQRREVTLFTLLLSAFEVLMSRWSGQSDLSVGTPIAGRTRQEIEGLIGMFVNTLVLRGDLRGDPGFGSFLKRTWSSVLEAYVHQDVPFEKLVEELVPERSLAHSPLFQVMFALQNVPEEQAGSATGLRVSALPTGGGTAMFDLVLAISERDGRLFGGLEYSTDLFDESTVARLLSHFENVLWSVVEEPEQPISTLPLLSVGEREQLLKEWNATAVAHSRGVLVHDLFAVQASRAPDVSAVAFAGEVLSYGELDRRSNRLARHLRRLGVGPEVLVGLYVERSVAMVVGLLGILKAGGAYVPLDPSHPAARLALVLKDAGATVMVTEERLLLAAAEPLRAGGAEIFCLDRDWEAVARESPTAPALWMDDESLVYIIYTSGSTGVPKGVQLPHRALVNFLRAMAVRPGFRPGERIAAVTTVSFDMAGLEIYLPLMSGGCIEVISREEAADGARLGARLARCGVTLLQATPVTWRLLVESGWQGLPGLKGLCGGEALPRELAEALLARGVELWNVYGPTETAILSAVGEVFSGTGPVHLGSPIDNTLLFVMDPGFQPVPVGVPGELWIAGGGVARGYLGRPDLTAEKFIADPFGDLRGEAGARLYRTGDLVRWRAGGASGELEFLGRIDHQVKVRGFRIELGEIESVLLEHGSVREAVVVAREEDSGDRRLVGYVVMEPGSGVGEEELRVSLRGKLPDYMVPPVVMRLSSLPLTPTGKVDRKALPAPAPAGSRAPVLSRGPVEELVARIWCEVLGLDGIGGAESFFDLGGHSLLATRVLSRVRTVFAVELPLRALFEAPTVAGFTQRIDLALRSGDVAAESPIEPVDRSGPLPLSFAQHRLWFLHQLEPESPAYNISSAILVQGELDVSRLEQSLSAVVRRHEILRTVFVALDGEPVQVIRPASVFPLGLVDLRGLEAGRGQSVVKRLAVAEAERPFDLAHGPLLRSTVVRLGPDEHAVLMTMHHIVSDGWSLGLFNSELMSLYASLRAGRASSLPELRVQYADFAVWQRRWLSSEVLQRKLDFWRERLAGVPPVLDLPTDRPRPAVQSWRGSVRGFGLPESLSGALRELGQRREVTLFTLLLSAFEVLMSRWSGQSDLSVGTPIAGRTRQEIEGLIGMFVNTLVLRGDLRRDPGFGSFLKRTWSSVLEAYVHQDVPFEKLVEELVPERSLAHSPLFQVMFALQNVPEEQAGSATGLRVSVLPTGGGTAMFDLMLAISERDGRLFGGLEYSTDLFDESTVARLLSHFENVLWSVVKEPEQPISALPLLSAGERAQVVVEWSHRSSGRVEGYRSVHELFAEEAGRSPEAIAVVSGIGSLSYGALDRSSNRWARRLRRLGVGRGSVVGVCLDRCQEMVAVLFGVLKAGAAYLPLDPSSPRQRLEYMLADAGAGVLVTGRALGEALSGAVPLVVELEGEGERLAAESCARVTSQVGPEDLAYVIYTSGSTGTPRGVLLKQGSLSSYARVVGGEVGLGPGERLLQFASLAFDTSAEEIFSCLLRGATLVLRPADMLGSMPHFARRCEELSLTVLDLPTAFWHELTSWLETEGAALPASVRLVIIGGEQALRERVSSWHRLVGDRVRLWNSYGPTETTIVATFCELTGGGGVKRSGEGVSIGSAVPGGRAQLLDRDLRPVPIGVAGELCIGGVGVARGYAGRPELTAERFVPDPFGGVWAEAGSRLYRTGDLGRHRVDGRLEFLGRIDHQVKVRGFRIELGEIESALLEHGWVREAVVVAREEDSGDRRLVGYVVMEPGSGGGEELRVFLRGRLPEYMVPSAVVQLSSLPLTPTGKVDRKALPAPALAGSTAPVLSRGPVEELVARIWCEVLGLAGIGGVESFFDLGGHSLLATRVLSRVRTVFAVELPLRALFEAPTVAGFAQRINLALRSGDVVAESPIEPVDRSGPLPLSFAQHRLWFLHQLEPESPAYNISSAILVQGELDVASLEQSLSEVVRRHEILRTVFAAVDGEPLQVIRPAAVFALGLVDLRGLEAGRGQSVVKRLAVAEAERPFDLARGPLLRSTVVRLGPDEHAVLMTMHHIVSDGWSLGLFNSELMSLYASLRAGRASSLPELRVQYADFAVWQRRWLSGEVLQRKLDFWRERLAGVPPVLDLPTDRPRPAVQSWRGSMRSFGLPESLSGALRGLGQRREVTLFTLLLSAFEVLMSRWSGQSDLSVGTPIAGRTRQEIEGLIGMFVNTLVLRGDLRGDPGFGSFLKRTWSSVLEAYVHQDVPFEKLVEELVPERSLAHSPLFQVMFALQNVPEEQAGSATGLRVSALPTGGGTAMFDLVLAISERDGRLFGGLEYSTDLFDESTVARLLSHFENVLRSVVEEPEQPISTLPLLSVGEREQLLKEWNATAVAHSRGVLVHDLFAVQASRAPDVSAVAFAGEVLSYGELDRRSNRLARHLRRLGVGPEVLVGLYVERSVAMVVGLLGILKAGGAYVPLDPAHPAARLALVLKDAGATVMVTEERLLLAAAEPLRAGGAEIFCLDRDWEAVARESPTAPALWMDDESLVYIIYTSGSTGVPKGVQLPHRALVNFLRAMAVRPGFGPGEKIAAVTTLSFDMAGLEIYLPLMCGGCIEVISREEAADGARLGARLARCGVTLLQATPVTWRLLVESGWQGLPGLKGLCGGEALPRELAEALLARGVELWNVYGPTETAILSAVGEVFSGRGPVHLGSPIDNTLLFVMDPGFQPVPVGVPGELWIAGGGVARGYLGRPDLTAEKFIADPFGDLRGEAGARLYRTGDLVRWRAGGASGELEFLGRIDHQVKVRGFRIELGEIESVLLEHGSVREAVVVAREEDSGDRRLVGYVVMEPGSGGGEELRVFLRGRLPEYMVPSAVVQLSSLPLTPTGKVDRKALPAPAPASSTAPMLSRGPVEELVAGIWCEVLGLAGIGGVESFFDLGGHSLLATRVLSRVRTVFAVELPLRALFEAPTVAGFAQRIDLALRSGEVATGSSIEPVDRSGPLPLSFAQHRLWFLHQLEPESPAYNISSAILVQGELDVSRLEQSLSAVVRRHEILRTVFAAVDGEPLQVIRPAAVFPLGLVDLRGLEAGRGQSVLKRLAVEEAERPFDLARGPLLRSTVVRLGPDEHAVLMTMHHIVSDGWSMGLFNSELMSLYASLRDGRASPLPELRVQYADFAVWQRRWLSGEVLQRKLDFWRERLAGVPPVLDLPTDRPRPAVQSWRGSVRGFGLPESLSGALRELGQRREVTLFTLLLSAFEVLMSRWSGQSDLSVGTPIAGRTRQEVEGLIGMFVNTLVLRGDLRGDPGFGSFLKRTWSSVLEAYVHQDVPFEKLVEELVPERSLAHSPLFQVMFALQNVPEEQAGSATGLRVSALPTGGGTAMFDLMLALWERDGRLFGGLEYSTDLFDESTVARLLSHFENVLRSVVEEPEQSISTLPLLSAGEREQLLKEWNATAVAHSRGVLVHDLFAVQASRAPDVSAVAFAGEVLSYGELDRRSNRLARHLRRLGVGPEVLVGLYVERSVAMVVGLLGILKAGGAYVPLDPAHPAARLALVLKDAGLTVMVTEERLLLAAPEPLRAGGAKIVCLDRDWEAVARESPTAPALWMDDESLVYIIYTSGSTGVPKGVQLPHRALVNFLRAMAVRPGFGPGEKIAAVTTLSFDMAGLEIYLPLMCGGCIEVISREEAADGARLGARLAICGATLLQATPVTWRLLVESGWQGLPGLKGLCGGEALPRELAEALLARGVELWNVYGPTETAILSAVGEVFSGTGPVHLGSPIDNTLLFVMDPGFQPVPVGVPGELWIAGGGVARGYLGRPDLTAEKFIADPFGDLRGEAGARLYRTGDLVRWRAGGASGELEFLGRIDHQVKVRGFRIELGEIESVLLEHGSVREAVVVAREEDSGDRRLVGYVVMEPGSGGGEELRVFLRGRLPEYMVPSAVVQLSSLPLTPTGKVDRKALAVPGSLTPRAGALMPRDTLELRLAQLWEELLKTRPIGVRDDFFALGGHSLLAVRLLARIRREFDRDLPLSVLFEARTIEGLARRLREGWEPPGDQLVVPIWSQGAKQPFFCVHPIGGNVLCYLELSHALGEDQPFYGVQSPRASSGWRIEDLAARYVDAVRQVQPEGPYALGGWSMGGVVAFEMSRYLVARGESVNLLALIDSYVMPTGGENDNGRAGVLPRIFAQDMADLVGMKLEDLDWSGADLDEESVLSRLLAEGQRQGALSASLSFADVRDVFLGFKRNHEALQKYVTGSYGGRVELFRAESSVGAEVDPTAGWSGQAAGGVQVHVLPGDHYSLLKAPYVAGVAVRLRALLDNVKTK